MNEDCPHCVFEITEANCRGCFEGSHYKPKSITNAERIRAMTDEELAEFITPVKCVDCHLLDCGVGVIGDNRTCEERVLDWLKEEAEGGEM